MVNLKYSKSYFKLFIILHLIRVIVRIFLSWLSVFLVFITVLLWNWFFSLFNFYLYLFMLLGNYSLLRYLKSFFNLSKKRWTKSFDQIKWWPGSLARLLCGYRYISSTNFINFSVCIHTYFFHNGASSLSLLFNSFCCSDDYWSIYSLIHNFWCH